MQALKVWQANLANRSEGTRQQYSNFFKKFCEWTGLTPDELREKKWKENQEEKPWERSQVENLLRQYIGTLGEYGCSTKELIIAAIRSFFKAQGMPLFLDSQDAPTGCTMGSKTLKHEQIRQLRNASEYLRDKALIMFLKDSGLRESDAAKMKWRDFRDYGEGFWGFEIQTKKKGTLARGFVGPETTEILKFYKEKRLQGTQKLPPEEDIENHPIFALLTDPTKPLRAAIMSGLMGDIIKLAGLEGISPHGLRKFWEQNMHCEKEAYQKQFNGRALTSVERAYNWKEIDELFKIYKVNYHNLAIEKQDFKEVEERLRREYEDEIKKLRDEIGRLETEKVSTTKELRALDEKASRAVELAEEGRRQSNGYWKFMTKLMVITRKTAEGISLTDEEREIVKKLKEITLPFPE